MTPEENRGWREAYKDWSLGTTDFSIAFGTNQFESGYKSGRGGNRLSLVFRCPKKGGRALSPVPPMRADCGPASGRLSTKDEQSSKKSRHPCKWSEIAPMGAGYRAPLPDFPIKERDLAEL